MSREVLVNLFTIVGVTASLVVLQVPASPSTDLAVFEAILKNKIRPEVDRFSAGAGIRTPAPVLAFDRTLMLCRPEGDHLRQMGCIRAEEIEFFEMKSPRMRTLMFEGRLTPSARQELATSFRERNRASQPFAGAKLDGVIPVQPEQLDEVRERELSQTRGISSFSLPAYSSDGHALVYASYVCGGLCGYGWLFLLEGHADSWRVVDIVMLWVS